MAATAPARPGRHFTYAEFIGRGACSGLSAAQRLAVHHLCHDYLDRVRDRFGPTVILSGCRSPGHNLSVGGAFHSWHLYGQHPGECAADFRCARGTPREWHAFLEELDPGGLGLYAGHVHVDNREHRARWTG